MFVRRPWPTLMEETRHHDLSILSNDPGLNSKFKNFALFRLEKWQDKPFHFPLMHYEPQGLRFLEPAMFLLKPYLNPPIRCGSG